MKNLEQLTTELREKSQGNFMTGWVSGGHGVPMMQRGLYWWYKIVYSDENQIFAKPFVRF